VTHDEGWVSSLRDALAGRPRRSLRPMSMTSVAAVLVVLLEELPSVEVLLERRSGRLPRHAGQYALPGGRVDRDDPDAEAAAVRETEEETGLDGRQLTVLGRLADRRTGTGWVITPVVATVPGSVRLAPNRNEVAELVRIPARVVCDDSSYRTVVRRQQGLLFRSTALVWQRRVVWGATAQILRSLGRVLRTVDGPW